MGGIINFSNQLSGIGELKPGEAKSIGRQGMNIGGISALVNQILIDFPQARVGSNRK